MNDNSELLTWAVQNITEWNDDYTHLRSDSNKVNSLFCTNGTSWRIRDNEWACPMGDDYTDDDDFCTSFSTKTPQVITKQEWETAKLRNAFNTVLEMRHSSSKADNTAQDGSQSQGEALQGLNEVQVGHIHAKLMAEYAEVAKTNPEPWKEFERRPKTYARWQELDNHPGWLDIFEYRRKPSPPKTMTIGGIVVEAWPLESNSDLAQPYYWAVEIDDGGNFYAGEFKRAVFAELFYNLLAKGKVFSTKEQAQAVADALNKLYNDALVGWKGNSYEYI